MSPPDAIKPDTFHRFPGVGKNKGNTAGWCILFSDGFGGAYGDWASDISESWHAEPNRQFTEDEKAAYKRNIAQARQRAAKEKKQQQTNTATKATAIWEEASPANPKHPYLVNKGIHPCIARQHASSLILPVMLGKQLASLQFIAGDGSKRFSKGGQVLGGCCAIAREFKDTKIVCIAEGFSTAATVYQATNFLVIIAFSARNLETVAKSVRQQFRESLIVICADDDKDIAGNPGITEATKAARAVGGKIAVPKFGDDRPAGASDFNDLAAHSGIEAVKQAISEASTPTSSSDTEESDWLKLVPLDIPNVPALKPDCLPDWAGEYARAVAADTETPLELAVGMILATCATACARRMKVVVSKSHSEPCNLWIVVALPPGNRKSSVQSAATAPLIEWERAQNEDMREDILRKTSERKTMEARIKDLRNKSARNKDEKKSKDFMEQAADIEVDLPKIPSAPRLWTSDATPERLGTLLEENFECLGWMSSEGGVFDQLEGRYSGGIPNLDLVLKAHSGDPERVDRGSRPPVDLEYPRLSFGISPQPDVLKGLTSKPGFRGRGLLARFLYFLPPSPLGYRTFEAFPVPENVKRAYMEGIHAMLNWTPDTDKKNKIHPHVVRISEDALALRHEFALAIEHQMRPWGNLEHFSDWASKAPGAAIRMAGVLHGIKHAHGRPWEHDIDQDTMKAALEIISVSVKHSLAALDLMGADKTVAAARQVWKWVERHKLAHFSERDAFNAHRSMFSRMPYLREALDVLVERGYVALVEHSKDGPGRKPSPVVMVRPELAESW